MKTIYILLFTLFSVNQIACDASTENASSAAEIKIDTIKTLIPETENKFKKQDFTKIEISDDSLDLALFNMMLESEKYTEEEIIQNAEYLIKKGANPNVSIEYKYSVRKLGTYIPVIKYFYNNKYRHYTTTSTAFLEAVNTKNRTIVNKFIELNADVNQASKAGMYPINLALTNNSEDIIDLLIQHHCDISVIDLSLSKDIDLIEKLVKQGVNPKTIDINFTINDAQTLNRLMRLHPDVNAYPLNYRKIFSNDTLLSYLLKNGLNNSARGDFSDDCPLIYGAIKYGDIKTVVKLKEAGINIHKNCGGIKSPVLFEIIKSQKIDFLDYYLNTEKVNPNTKDWTDKSALLIAVNTDNDEIIKILIKAGANMEYTGYFKDTPLMNAAKFDKYISAQTLINLGANINYKSKYGETALTIAINRKKLAMIKLLVENGANTKIKYKNLSLSEYARSKEAPNMIIEYLKSHE